MLGYGMFIDGMSSLDGAGALCQELFWTDLYNTYPGIEREEPDGQVPTASVVR
jgi:hypothetical protein